MGHYINTGPYQGFNFDSFLKATPYQQAFEVAKPLLTRAYNWYRNAYTTPAVTNPSFAKMVRRRGFPKPWQTKPRKRFIKRTFGKKKRTFRRMRRKSNNAKNASKRITIHGVSLLSNVWKLDKDNNYTKPALFQIGKQFLPAEGSNAREEHIFNSYRSHRLIRFSWKIENIRIFQGDVIQMPAVATGSYPATQNCTIDEHKDWRILYLRDNDARRSGTQGPTPNSENQFSICDRKGLNNKIWGSVNYTKNGRTSAFDIPKDYGTSPYSVMKGRWAELYNMTTELTTDKRLDLGTTATWNPSDPNVWIMPDDPYASKVFTDQKIASRISFTADLHTYVTIDNWNEYKKWSANADADMSKEIIEGVYPNAAIHEPAIQGLTINVNNQERPMNDDSSGSGGWTFFH